MMIRQRCLLRCDQQGCHHSQLAALTTWSESFCWKSYLLIIVLLTQNSWWIINFQLQKLSHLMFLGLVCRLFIKNCLLNDFQCWKSIWIKLSVDEKKEVVMFSFPSRAWNIITWSNSFFQHNDIVKSYQQFTIIL